MTLPVKPLLSAVILPVGEVFPLPKFTSISFEDYSKIAIDIDKKDEKYNAQTYDSLKGIRMPDAISVYTVDGIDYLITANEGDSRDWNGYSNEIVHEPCR